MSDVLDGPGPGLADKPKGKRLWRLALGLSTVALMCVWATGTLTAFAGAKFPPHTCKAPYTGWALTWPIWKIMPTAVEVRFVAWTFTFCE